MAVLEAKLVITADDRTGSAFKAIEAHVERISTLSKEIGRLSGAATGVSHGASLAAEFERAEAAAKHFAASVQGAGEAVAKIAAGFENVAVRARRAEHEVSTLGRAAHAVRHAVKDISPLVMGGAGFGILETTKEWTRAGAEVQGERARAAIAGIKDRDIDAADRQAGDLAARYPNVSRAQVLENFRELRSVLQNPDETPEMLPTLIKARSSMAALDPSGHSAEGLKYAIKGAELLGKARNPEAFSAYLDGFIRAQQVMGSTASPEQLGDFAKYTRSSGQLLSDRFLHTTANSLIQEEKGSTAGKMVADVVKEMTGSFAGYHEPAKALMHLGLADKADFDLNKQGDIKGLKPGRHVRDWQLWQSDPDRAVWEKLVPAMIAKGINDPQAQVAMARQLFPNSLAADFVSKLILQRPAFENHSKLYGEAAGIDGGQKLLGEDPSAALGALGTAIKSFGSDITSPIMKDAAGTLNSWAQAIGTAGNAVAKWSQDHPDFAKMAAKDAIVGGVVGGGALGYGLIEGLGGGFGLKGAAVDLTAAAEALKGAAAVEAGHGAGAPPGAGADTRKPSLFTPLWQYWLYDQGKGAIDGLMAMLPKPRYPTGYDPKKELEKGALEHFGDAVAHAPALAGTWDRGLFHAAPSGYGRDFTLGSSGGFDPGPGKAVPPGGFGYMSDWDAKHNVGRSPLGIDPGALAGSLSNVKATVEGPVTAQLTGEAQVKVSVTVTPSSSLIQAAATATSTSIKANVGTALPEAAAGSRGANGTARQ